MGRFLYGLLGFAFVLAIVSLVTFLASAPGPETTFRVKPEENTILFAVTPWEESRDVREAYKPLLEFLGQKTGKKFQLLITEDYDAAIDSMVDGTVDIAILPPVSFIIAKERNPDIQYISTVLREREGKLFSTYRGHILTLKSKFPGWSFDDFIKEPGKYRLGLVSKKSSSGWAYPMAMMKKMGIDPQTVFKSITIYDQHTDLTDALAAGKIDLGATWEYNLEQATKKHGDIYSVIWTSPPIPGIVWAAGKRIDPSLIAEIRSVQHDIVASPELRARLLSETPDKGWEVVDETFYDSTKEVMRYVGAFE